MASKGKASPWLVAGLGSVLCLIVTGLLVLLFGKLILEEKLPIAWSAFAAYICVGVAAFAGSLLTVCRVKSGKLLFSLVTGGFFMGCLVLGNVIAFEGSFHRLWLTASIILAASSICGLLGARKRKRQY